MRNVIVSGGSRGLGLAICRRLSQAGYRVIALARRRTAEFDQAMAKAGPGERLGFEFYHHVAETAPDAAVRSLAKAFAREEAEHVRLIERWMSWCEANW